MQRLPLLLFAIAATAYACGSDDESDGTPTAVPPSQEARTPVPTPLSPRDVETKPQAIVTGLFTDPRPAPATVARPLEERPASPFSPYDQVSVVLYDLVEMKETNLGPGNRGQFNADSTHMVWLRGGAGEQLEAVLLDLITMEEQSLGAADSACWHDSNTVTLRRPGANGAEGPGTLIDISGARADVASVSCAENFDITTTRDGLELRREYSTIDTPVPMSNWYLTDRTTGDLLLVFEAYQAVPSGPGWLAVASVIEVADAPTELGLAHGTTNVFLVEIATGEATFVATSPWVYANWPLVANQDYVVWTDAFCGQPQGSTHLYNRASGEIFDLEQSLWPIAFTDDGQLATDSFGPRSLIDLDAMSYDVVLPGGEPEWSPDWRYASVGVQYGHGGLCP